MGPICDRTTEHLGASDIAVIEWRKRILAMAKNLAAGTEPAEPFKGAAYNVRPASLLLDREIEFQEGAGAMLAGIEMT